jgi:hypothetical protein
MLADPVLDDGKTVRVGRRPARIVPNMDVNERRPGFESRMGALDLLCRRHGNGRILFLGRLAAGDRNGNDAGCGHGPQASCRGTLARPAPALRAALRPLDGADMLPSFMNGRI